MKRIALKKVRANAVHCYLLLAFVAMAGLSYVNYLPMVVNALADGIGFNSAEAGQIVAFNGYGGLIGCLVAVFLVDRINWRAALLFLLIVLFVLDLSTNRVLDYNVMLVWRFAAGALGGLCVGIGISALAKLQNPDRAFGLLLFVQFTLGAVVIYLLPNLELQLDSYAVFYVMAGITLTSFVFLLFLPTLLTDKQICQIKKAPIKINKHGFLLLLAIVCYQTAAYAIWGYVGLIGSVAQIDADSINTYIATTGLLGLLGALIPAVTGERFGRLFWLVVGIIFSIIASFLLNNTTLSPTKYVMAIALLFLSWPAVLSYLLATTAQLDNSGRLSTIANLMAFASMGFGPQLAALLSDEASFSTMLMTCTLLFVLCVLLLLRPVKALNIGRDRGLSAQPQL